MAVETVEYLAMLRRLIRRAGERVADADEIELTEFLALQSHFDAAVAVAIAGQRETGRSWADIGAAAGITRQSAHERWGRK